MRVLAVGLARHEEDGKMRLQGYRADAATGHRLGRPVPGASKTEAMLSIC